MSEHAPSSGKNVLANETGRLVSGDTLIARARPSAGDRPIGISCRLCGRELRDNDDLSVHDRQLVHLRCCEAA
jgi:hypothetical protein